MISFGVLNNICKNCGKNNLLIRKEYKCHSCEKGICKSCSLSPVYLLGKSKYRRLCFECFDKNDIAIRKMIAVDSGSIREYNIVSESNCVFHSNYFSDPTLALEHLKYRSLINGFNAVTHVKYEKGWFDTKKLGDFNGNKFRRYKPTMAHSASGILVSIDKNKGDK